MVKVLPNNFTLYESQRILSPTGEPLAISCSNDLLFIAVEECTVEVYDLQTLEQLARFRTVSPVASLAYNNIGDCVVTLERKLASSQGFVRVYFKWRGLSADKPMRILMASIQRSIPGQNRIAAEIVELPSDAGSSVSCLACCQYTGRIAVAMGSLLRVFCIEKDEREHSRGTSASPSSSLPCSPPSLPSLSSPTPNIEILLDIQTNTAQLEMVSIMGDYIAFISTNEARVVKLSLFHTGSNPIPDYHSYGMGTEDLQKGGVATEGTHSQLEGDIVEDKYFVSWSPSAVWEAEKKAHKSCLDHMTSHDTTNPGDHVASGDSHMTSGDNDTAPVIGTITLESILQATSETQGDRATMEVLGPVEYVWGQPLTVTVNHATPDMTKPECRVLTMLYRRFMAEVAGTSRPGTTSQFMGLSRNSRATLPVRVQGGMRVKGGWDGLHTVQLIPTFASNSGSASGPPELVGISCFLANRFHSYLYDVHQHCRLLSSFSFMEKSCLASCDGTLLHALSSDSVETYTSRAFQAAISNLPRGSAVIPHRVAAEGEERVEGERTTSDGSFDARQSPDHETWLRQPIPPHKLDLTLVSTSKFIGCCYLATSRDYIIVVAKGDAEPQTPNNTSWLLQSLTLHKAKTEQMWNIYVLKLKSGTALFQQFMEFADSMKDTSPPMRQHLLSEGHVLLRRQIVQDGCSAQLVKWLQDNCFQLADSLCHYSRWNGIETHASHYFIMSGRPIVDAVRHILSNYTTDNKIAYSVLMTYLNLVLFERGNAEKQMPLLQPLADKVLELYASHNSAAGHMRRGSGHVIPLLLDSWLSGYSSDKALILLETHLQSTTVEENCVGTMCHAMLCLRSGRDQEAAQRLHHTPKDCLQKWMADNSKFIWDSSTLTFTPLGKLVMAVQESCLLELLVTMLKSSDMTFDDLCTLIKNSAGQDVEQDAALKHFLEMVVLDKSKVILMATTNKAVLLLVGIFFGQLSINDDVVSKSSKKSPPFVLYGTRPKWLDNVAPFGGRAGDVGLAEAAALSKRKKQLQNLMQLQTLLCSSHMTDTVATRVEEFLTQSPAGGEGEDSLLRYRLSLQLITWPHLGRMKEACQLCLDYCPLAIIDYCLSVCPSDLDLWAWLLQWLLGYTEVEGDPGQEPYKSLYKEALSHVLTLTTPQQFLSLLPDSGSVAFFLPFIERSCKLHYSRAVSEELHNSILEQ